MKHASRTWFMRDKNLLHCQSYVRRIESLFRDTKQDLWNSKQDLGRVQIVYISVCQELDSYVSRTFCICVLCETHLWRMWDTWEMHVRWGSFQTMSDLHRKSKPVCLKRPAYSASWMQLREDLSWRLTASFRINRITIYDASGEKFVKKICTPEKI
jgi:hypothetical protein